jgi:hypothetical protein
MLPQHESRFASVVAAQFARVQRWIGQGDSIVDMRRFAAPGSPS